MIQKQECIDRYFGGSWLFVCLTIEKFGMELKNKHFSITLVKWHHEKTIIAMVTIIEPYLHTDTLDYLQTKSSLLLIKETLMSPMFTSIPVSIKHSYNQIDMPSGLRFKPAEKFLWTKIPWTYQPAETDRLSQTWNNTQGLDKFLHRSLNFKIPRECVPNRIALRSIRSSKQVHWSQLELFKGKTLAFQINKLYQGLFNTIKLHLKLFIPLMRQCQRKKFVYYIMSCLPLPFP